MLRTSQLMFLGPDASLTSLHCEPAHRGKGFGWKVVAKLHLEQLCRYGDDARMGLAFVGADNAASQAVMRSLSGQKVSEVSW